MLSVAKEKDAPLILMHMRGTPKTMMSADMKAYHNVVGDVMEYLLTRTEACEAMGIGRTKLMLDPGLGFAKDVSGNLELSRGLAELTGHGIPVLVAGSRKGYIGKVLGDLPPEERLEGTMALSAAAVLLAPNGSRPRCQGKCTAHPYVGGDSIMPVAMWPLAAT